MLRRIAQWILTVCFFLEGMNGPLGSFVPLAIFLSFSDTSSE